jgi:hypothetical protein
MKAAQLREPISAGNDTKEFVTGVHSWIISIHQQGSESMSGGV